MRAQDALGDTEIEIYMLGGLRIAWANAPAPTNAADARGQGISR